MPSETIVCYGSDSVACTVRSLKLPKVVKVHATAVYTQMPSKYKFEPAMNVLAYGMYACIIIAYYITYSAIIKERYAGPWPCLLQEKQVALKCCMLSCKPINHPFHIKLLAIDLSPIVAKAIVQLLLSSKIYN